MSHGVLMIEGKGTITLNSLRLIDSPTGVETLKAQEISHGEHQIHRTIWSHKRHTRS